MKPRNFLSFFSFLLTATAIVIPWTPGVARRSETPSLTAFQTLSTSAETTKLAIPTSTLSVSTTKPTSPTSILSIAGAASITQVPTGPDGSPITLSTALDAAALEAQMKWHVTTYWSCVTWPATTHCGWHEPVVPGGSEIAAAPAGSRPDAWNVRALGIAAGLLAVALGEGILR